MVFLLLKSTAKQSCGIDIIFNSGWAAKRANHPVRELLRSERHRNLAILLVIQSRTYSTNTRSPGCIAHTISASDSRYRIWPGGAFWHNNHRRTDTRQRTPSRSAKCHAVAGEPVMALRDAQYQSWQLRRNDQRTIGAAALRVLQVFNCRTWPALSWPSILGILDIPQALVLRKDIILLNWSFVLLEGVVTVALVGAGSAIPA